MSIVTSAGEAGIRDKFESEINAAVAKLETLKAEAETAKATSRLRRSRNY